MAKVLYITYDGLTDPIGQSQILPYLAGLSQIGHRISILSCEKKLNYHKHKTQIEAFCNKENIQWEPLFFHSFPPLIAKYLDLTWLESKAKSLQKKQSFDLIHCRSYVAGYVGMKLKRKYKIPFLFDMRGFWVNERVDGGLWNLNSFIYKIAYRTWKKKEKEMLQNADHIISLTEAGKNEMRKWEMFPSDTPVTVIPCSADMELFTVTSLEQRMQSKKDLGINDDSFVLGYLGSIGTWYLLDEMFQLFKEIKQTFLNAKFLIVTKDSKEYIFKLAQSCGLNKDDLVVREANRGEVPKLMKASDVSVSFIKPTYSKIASSPIKLGELLSMGIPVICNDIGDVSEIISLSKGGVVLEDFTPESMKMAVDCIKNRFADPCSIRNNIRHYYDIQFAIKSYAYVYDEVVSNI